MPTMAGMPMVRARMAVWLEPEPPAVMKPKILDLSSWIVSDGARSSAQSSTGTSDAIPPCTHAAQDAEDALADILDVGGAGLHVGIVHRGEHLGKLLGGVGDGGLGVHLLVE